MAGDSMGHACGIRPGVHQDDHREFVLNETRDVGAESMNATAVGDERMPPQFAHSPAKAVWFRLSIVQIHWPPNFLSNCGREQLVRVKRRIPLREIENRA